MEIPKKTCSKQSGRPKVGIGRIRKYVVSTRLSPERKLRFSALCREAGQPPAEVLRQLIDRGTVRARITREQLDFMAQLKGVARNLNQLTRLANAKVCRELIEKHGLYLAPGKDDVQRERLREPDKTRYEIHDAIKSSLPKCKSWNGLEFSGSRSTGHSALRSSTTGSPTCNSRRCIGPSSSGTSRRRQAITGRHLQGCSAAWAAAVHAKSHYR